MCCFRSLILERSGFPGSFGQTRESCTAKGHLSTSSQVLQVVFERVINLSVNIEVVILGGSNIVLSMGKTLTY